jgi:hypothetical protein
VDGLLHLITTSLEMVIALCFGREQSFDFFHVWMSDACFLEFLEVV